MLSRKCVRPLFPEVTFGGRRGRPSAGHDTGAVRADNGKLTRMGTLIRVANIQTSLGEYKEDEV